MTRLVAGCMTGTSIDSLDAAVVRVEGAGLAMQAKFVRGTSRPLGDLARPLRRLADQEPIGAGEIARASREFSLLHVEALRELARGEQVDLIAVHGQTVYHAPPVSWQMITPAPIAQSLGVPVVFDLRAADLAAGGQGAPITPIADWVTLRDAGESRAVVNLGGFCNVTMLPAGSNPATIRGADACACNHLLDTIARRLLNAPYDKDGARALSGTANDAALEDLGGVIRGARRSGRSLGTGDESTEWVSRWQAHVKPEDLAATACEGIALAIADAVSGVDRALVAGGSVRNRALIRAISSCCSARVEPTDAYGVPAEYREAACMGVLGALCRDRIPITLPQVTGVREPAPVAGVWVYP